MYAVKSSLYIAWAACECCVGTEKVCTLSFLLLHPLDRIARQDKKEYAKYEVDVDNATIP